MHSKLLKNEEVVNAIKRDSINFLNLFFQIFVMRYWLLLLILMVNFLFDSFPSVAFMQKSNNKIRGRGL